MRNKQTVANMAEEVLGRQARDRAGRAGEPFEAALETHSPHGCQSAQEWHKNLRRERVVKERNRAQGQPE